MLARGGWKSGRNSFSPRGAESNRLWRDHLCLTDAIADLWPRNSQLRLSLRVGRCTSIRRDGNDKQFAAPCARRRTHRSRRWALVGCHDRDEIQRPTARVNPILKSARWRFSNRACRLAELQIEPEGSCRQRRAGGLAQSTPSRRARGISGRPEVPLLRRFAGKCGCRDASAQR
jgi:hypothetical protein